MTSPNRPDDRPTGAFDRNVFAASRMPRQDATEATSTQTFDPAAVACTVDAELYGAFLAADRPQICGTTRPMQDDATSPRRGTRSTCVQPVRGDGGAPAALRAPVRARRWPARERCCRCWRAVSLLFAACAAPVSAVRVDP